MTEQVKAGLKHLSPRGDEMTYSPNKTLHGNFKIYEVAKSSTAIRLGIDNTPSDEVIERAEQVAIHILQPVREHFGIPFSPNSWFRCEELERAITKNSFPKWCVRHGFATLTHDQIETAWQEYFSLKSHPKGEAVDFELPGISNTYLFNWCKENLPQYDQLIAEFMKPDDPAAGWVHGSHSENNRHQIITIK